MLVGRYLHRFGLEKRFFKRVSFKNSNAEENVFEIIDKTLADPKMLKTKENWMNFRARVIDSPLNRGYINTNNIESILISHCLHKRNYELADELISSLIEKPNLATIGNYFKLLHVRFGLQTQTLNHADEMRIIAIYKELRIRYPILDSITLEHVILPLSLTSEWRVCLALLKEIGVSNKPISAAYSATAAAAFKNGEEEIGWQLFDEMLKNNRMPNASPYAAFLQLDGKLDKAGPLDKLEKIFAFIQKHDLNIQNEVAEIISNFANKFGLKCGPTTINRNTCRKCNTKLQKLELSDSEFHELQVSCLENVIVGKDLFVKTNPVELEKFKGFIAQKQKFDVVLDGLNVAYSAGTKKSPQVYSAFVAGLVEHFVQQQKSVLVLGRMHMNRWPAQNWSYVLKNAAVFLTQNISQDDPYLLYCALNSGKGTIIVTRDLMRGHRFLLKNSRLKILFNRWLEQRQFQLVRFDGQQKPIFKLPLPFTSTPQKTSDYWHIPYLAEEKSEYHSWMCLKC